MLKMTSKLSVFVLAFSLVILSSCGTNQAPKDSNTEQANPAETELLKAQNDMYEIACRDISDINQKVVELNRKITSMSGKLTEQQNNAIDEIEVKRTSISSRMKGLKKVPMSDWENFKSTMEQDINDTKTKLDELIGSIK